MSDEARRLGIGETIFAVVAILVMGFATLAAFIIAAAIALAPPDGSAVATDST